MAGSLNRATIIGHCGADPEIRTTQAGKKVASLRIATSDSWTDKTTGEKKESTDWHACVVWNEHLIPVIEKYVRKGSKVLLEGQIKTRKWTDKDGAERYTTEIVLQGFNGQLILLGSPGDKGKAEDPAQTKAAPAPAGKTPPKKIDLDDSIPF